MKKMLFTLLTALILLAAGVFAWLTFTEYNPPPREPALRIGPPSAARLAPVLRVLTWNIGYAGLDASADFFMDGGRNSRAPNRETVERNLTGIVSQLEAANAGVLLLQEADRGADRSFRIDQAERIANAFPGLKEAYYTTNYRTPFVPAPWRRPMGRVESGLLSLLPAAEHAERLAFPGRHPWPKRLFHLKRCAMLLRLSDAQSGAKWSLINVHLEAFDRGGDLRRLQLAFVRELILFEHAAGRAVIAGGDWNCEFPGVDRSRFPATEDQQHLLWLQAIPSDWTPPGWQWAFDPDVPTVRTNGLPYRPGVNNRTIIDGFLLSPNVKKLDIQAIDLEFAHSDHNPVLLEAALAG